MAANAVIQNTKITWSIKEVFVIWQSMGRNNKDKPINTTPPPLTVGLTCKERSLGLSMSRVFLAITQNSLVKRQEKIIKKALRIIMFKPLYCIA